MYVVINGGGKIGEYLATKLLGRRHEVAIIEQSGKKIEHLTVALPGKALMILGDGCDSVYQADAGTGEADIFVATTGSDDVNLVSCEIASLVFGVPRTIARVNNPKNERIFRRIGIEAVSSTTVITRLIESEATEGAVHAIMSLTQGDLVMTEVSIPKRGKAVADSDNSARGRKVADIALPAGSLLVAVGRGASLEIVTGATVLYPGDAVICVSKEGLEDKVRDALLSL
ncbi:MAG: TrkA family potassium uptake protein [Coriobacteriales bacterium]|jgi:trk system potassium uptake protein TrkA|nr:TrkA family potassium uptake protein [Coriobacteriales bacterium]